jgi:alanyl-tRNA synthetase
LKTHWNIKMTDRLYYADSYTTRFEATVIEQTTHDDKPALVLNQTYFYPTSGGQPHDTGTINGFPVADVIVRDEDAEILHIIDTPTPSLLEQTVTCEVNWARRFDHMQQHTGQHILTQAFIQAAGAKTVSFHLSPESVTIDLDVNSLTDSQIETAEHLANEVIQADKSVSTTLRQMDEQDGVRMRKMPKHIVTDGLRVVEIEGFDTTACGGTHVSRTGEIGLLKIIKMEKRGDKTRLEFRCGGRALSDYGDKHQVISTLAAEMNCRFPEVPDNIARLRTELKTAQTALKELREQLVEYEAVKLLAEAPRPHGYALITASFDGRDAGELKLLASRLTTAGSAVVLMGTAGEKAQLIFARSPDLQFNMGALLKDAVGKLGGRGGGQPAFAQGGGVTATAEQIRNVIETTVASL